MINLSSTNLTDLIEKIQSIYIIWSVTLKVNTSQDFKETFSIFPPMSHEDKLVNYDAATANWKILPICW